MGDYLDIAKHYDNCFSNHGDTPKGLDWPDIDGMITRFKVMSDLIKEDNASLIDLGCGTGKFYTYIKTHLPKIYYRGLDINQPFIDFCKNKYPSKAPDFSHCDILQGTSPLADYYIMNGIFTVKRDLKQEEMWDFLTKMITQVHKNTFKGFGLNLMSKNVDWERDDLFHVSLDDISKFLCKNISRNFVIRNDYGLYEYTVYVYK